MKKFMLSLAAMVICTLAIAQNDYKKNPTLGVQFILNDFQTASEIRNSGGSSVLDANQWYKLDRMKAGLAITYTKGITDHLDFNGALSGSILDYPVPNKLANREESLLLEAAATANLKLVSDKFCVVPYLTLGLGASKFGGYYGAFIPTGVGLQLKLAPETHIVLNAQYRIPVSENIAYHFYYGMGITQSIKNKKVPPPPPVVVIPVVVDKDGDGILDVNDKCPDVAGIASLQGCPDRDADGIADGDDKCPDVAGIAKYAGCPIPDTDGDGINDEQDKCPNEKGFARYQGCPIPDKDGDGINDEEDKCPNVAGLADNFGCPVIGIKAYEIAFKSGSAVLLPKTKPLLDTVVTYLKTNSGVNVTIDGHTDNTGSDKINNPLSVKRAEATKAYLVSKGIDASRMTTAGFGSTQPVADNKTVQGRQQNRRIEIKIQ